jgi:hypothetical protein
MAYVLSDPKIMANSKIMADPKIIVHANDTL